MEGINLNQQYLPQLLVFLYQHKYLVKGYNPANKGNTSIQGIVFEEHGNAIYVSGVVQGTSMNVSIKISLSNQESYEMVKQESEILKNLMHFHSVVKYVDEFDFEDQSSFILITEQHDQSISQIIQEHNKKNTRISLEKLVISFYRATYALFEIHENGHFHGNIQLSSIVVTPEGEYKFRNFVSKETLFDRFDASNKISEQSSQTSFNQIEQLEQSSSSIVQQQDSSNRFYTSPEIKKYIKRRKNNSLKPILLALQYSDIYSLGLVFLSMIQSCEISPPIYQLVKEEQFNVLQKSVEKNQIRLISFLSNFMLNKNPTLRNTANQLRKSILFSYENVYLFPQKELTRVQDLLKEYEENHILTEHFKTFLICQMVQCDLNNQVFVNLQYSRKLLYNLDKKTIEKNHFLLQELGQTYYFVGEFKLALKYFIKSFEIKSQFYPENHQHRAETLKEIGNTYRFIDTNIQNAHNYKTLALRMYEQLYRENHESIADTIKALGDDCYHFESDKNALLYYQNSLAIRKTLYINNHLYLTQTISCIIKCLNHTREYDKIFYWNLKNFKIKQTIFKNFPYEDLTSILSIFLKIKEPHKKLKYNLKILKILKNVPNCYVKLKANILQNISFNYMELNDLESASIYEIQSHNILSNLY